MFPPLDIPIEYWIEHVTFGLLYVMFRFSTRIFFREIPGFATDYPCCVWCRGLTTCLLYAGTLFGNQVWNDSGFVSLTQWRTTFSLFWTAFYIYLNAPQYENTLFSFTLFSCLKHCFIFTEYLSTLLLHRRSLDTFIRVVIIVPADGWTPLGHLEAMMTSSNGNIFRVTSPLWEEFTGHRWIPLTKASDAKLWCYLWSS